MVGYLATLRWASPFLLASAFCLFSAALVAASIPAVPLAKIHTKK